VSWFDATSYCYTLTVQERLAGRIPSNWAYRLPTEAEWEYACRAGTAARFSYGDDLGYTDLGKYAWYCDNSDLQTHPVGRKRPNAWGLYDMHGNVLEWCLDWHGEYPGGSVSDPQGLSSCSDRVFRGGSWSRWLDWNGPRLCRSAYRNSYDPEYWYRDIGFRAVLAPGQ